MKANLASVVRAINGFGGQAEDMPGSRARVMDKYGTDPDFIAFAAAVAGEMKEDRTQVEGLPGSEIEVEALQTSEAYWTRVNPDHLATKAKVEANYTRKYGAEAHRLHITLRRHYRPDNSREQ